MVGSSRTEPEVRYENGSLEIESGDTHILGLSYYL